MNDISTRILAALSTEGQWVSSARMVGALGVSRMAVCKQVHRLQQLGYGIEAAPRLGYRLTGRTAQAVPEEVEPLLRTLVIGRPYQYFAEIDSTNAFLRGRMDALPEGATVVADSQRAGRGRLQREWFSPPGVNVYLSVLLKPAVSPMLAPPLSLVAAAAVLRAVHSMGGAEACVKWPNDILWQGKKLAGILCEMNAEADRVQAVILGIGVNANLTAFPENLTQTATSLHEVLGRPVSVPVLTAAILNHLDEEYASWLRDGLSGSVSFLNRHSMLAGCEVSIALLRDKIRGRVECITEDGMLRLAMAGGGTRDITSGEVQLCRHLASRRNALRRMGYDAPVLDLEGADSDTPADPDFEGLPTSGSSTLSSG